MNIIETRNLTQYYWTAESLQDLPLTAGWRTQVLYDVTLDVPEGSIFALLGSNGAGKTTTIKVLINLLRPSAGSVRVLGIDSVRLGETELANIGYVSENQQLPLWMTVRQFLDYCRQWGHRATSCNSKAGLCGPAKCDPLLWLLPEHCFRLKHQIEEVPL